MKTLRVYATSLYLLITCLTLASVNGYKIEIQNSPGSCLSTMVRADIPTDQVEVPIEMSVVYFDKLKHDL